jgi:hypothetical protein
MKYYPAVVDEQEIKASCLLPPLRFLASYHYCKTKQEIINKYTDLLYDVFIDSGAFSADNCDASINIDEYCEFIKQTGVRKYATLDVIGDPIKTLENHNYMINEHGLKPMITFHMGSTIKDLDKLLHFDYIALGGMVMKGGKFGHLDAVWDHILRHNAKIKVHGFGLTNVEIIDRYPWHSVDSSSFKGCKRFGRQAILWDGFGWKSMDETKYQAHMTQLGCDFKTMENKMKWFIYDHYCSQSYKLYVQHITETHKHKDFKYLTQQYKLF